MLWINGRDIPSREILPGPDDLKDPFLPILLDHLRTIRRDAATAGRLLLEGSSFQDWADAASTAVDSLLALRWKEAFIAYEKGKIPSPEEMFNILDPLQLELRQQVSLQTYLEGLPTRAAVPESKPRSRKPTSEVPRNSSPPIPHPLPSAPSAIAEKEPTMSLLASPQVDPPRRRKSRGRGRKRRRGRSTSSIADASVSPASTTPAVSSSRPVVAPSLSTAVQACAESFPRGFVLTVRENKRGTTYIVVPSGIGPPGHA